jgi:mono/diheme cytochrome c family protein
MGKHLKHPFGQAVLVLVVSYLFLDYGIAYISPLIGITSGPVPIPNSVLLQYLITVAVGILLWVSDNDARWAEFKAPMHRVMVDPDRKIARNSLMVLVPILVAFATFNQVKPSVAAPTTLRSIHPSAPGQFDFQGTTLELADLENPLRSRGSLEEHYEEGKRVYYENCLGCHGDGLDGQGHYAHGFNPAPLSFQDVGTIAQLVESFVFWRIAKGGPGLPNEGAPWNSAMPAWEDFLTEDEIWSVIIFLYEQTGHEPRTFEEEAGEGEAG